METPEERLRRRTTELQRARGLGGQPTEEDLQQVSEWKARAHRVATAYDRRARKMIAATDLPVFYMMRTDPWREYAGFVIDLGVRTMSAILGPDGWALRGVRAPGVVPTDEDLLHLTDELLEPLVERAAADFIESQSVGADEPFDPRTA